MKPESNPPRDGLPVWPFAAGAAALIGAAFFLVTRKKVSAASIPTPGKPSVSAPKSSVPSAPPSKPVAPSSPPSPSSAERQYMTDANGVEWKIWLAGDADGLPDAWNAQVSDGAPPVSDAYDRYGGASSVRQALPDPFLLIPPHGGNHSAEVANAIRQYAASSQAKDIIAKAKAIQSAKSEYGE